MISWIIATTTLIEGSVQNGHSPVSYDIVKVNKRRQLVAKYSDGREVVVGFYPSIKKAKEMAELHHDTQSTHQ